MSGVDSFVLWPPLVAFIVSFFTSMGGVSGAFLLLPYQMSVMGYTTPSVSATNQIYNIIGIPSGVYRYIREKRMVSPLLGSYHRYPSWRTYRRLGSRRLSSRSQAVQAFRGIRASLHVLSIARDIYKSARGAALQKRKGQTAMCALRDARFSLACVEYRFAGNTYTFSPWSVLLLCVIVGVVGGIYGVGGGAIIAPFFVTIFKMPIYTVAGAALMGTFLTSLAGAGVLSTLDMATVGSLCRSTGLGFGSSLRHWRVRGNVFGARCQKHVPARWIKGLLAVICYRPHYRTLSASSCR